jgi:hypothetical protein
VRTVWPSNRDRERDLQQGRGSRPRPLSLRTFGRFAHSSSQAILPAPRLAVKVDFHAGPRGESDNSGTAGKYDKVRDYMRTKRMNRQDAKDAKERQRKKERREKRVIFAVINCLFFLSSLSVLGVLGALAVHSFRCVEVHEMICLRRAM